MGNSEYKQDLKQQSVSLTSTHFIKYMQLIQADLFCCPSNMVLIV